MTSIDRTAYPRLGKQLNDQELALRYELDEQDLQFINQHAYHNHSHLLLAVMLKTRQQLGYFIKPDQIPRQIINYIARQLSTTTEQWLADPPDKKTLYRFRIICRQWLNSTPFSTSHRNQISDYVNQAAYTMSDPADLINVAIEALVQHQVELPAFSTLDRLVNHERQSVHQQLYQQITVGISDNNKQCLDGLLEKPEGKALTGFAQLKQTPGPATLKHFRVWAQRLEQLDNLIDPKPFLQGVAHTKIRQFAAEATAHSIGDIRGIRDKARCYTLLLCLLYQSQCKTRDELIEMFIKRMKSVQRTAQEQLRQLQERQRVMEEAMIGVLDQVVQQANVNQTDSELGTEIRQLFAQQGGSQKLAEQLQQLTAYHQNNYWPFLWPAHKVNRAVIFRVLERIHIRSATQDQSLLQALEFVQKHRHTRKPYLPVTLPLSFASQRWQRFVSSKINGEQMYDRKALEVCVFLHLAEALQSIDLYVDDSEAYADYRQQLLSWEDCQTRLEDYFQSLELPSSGSAMVSALHKELSSLAARIDLTIPANSEFSIDVDGVPHLKRQKVANLPEGVEEFKSTVYGRLPERHLLDILKHVQHWSRFARHFNPPSGADPKLLHADSRYLFTVFGYGCNLGASQTARHAPDTINRQTLRRINTQHINANKLEAAANDIIAEYARFELPGFWGSRKVAIADGTQMELRKNNLLGEQHIRYGGYGGIAYHHISGDYIALFSHFIACGVWEAVYILDALLLKRPDYQPDTLHADTHGQSEPVFALAYLLGIRLFPRMRTWNDVNFYRPDSRTRYEHIDELFDQVVNWKLIETHWQDMMQVVLSIQAGKVLPSMLLRKLNSRNRQNKLYRAFRELGRVVRTLFLLRYISESDFRQTIRAETTKIESHNDFLDWINFGGTVIKSGDPVEQEKQVKYTNLIANAIMLHNVADLTDVLTDMAAEEMTVTPELIASLSPTIREQIRRFGRYDVDMNEQPPPLNPGPIRFG